MVYQNSMQNSMRDSTICFKKHCIDHIKNNKWDLSLTSDDAVWFNIGQD